MGTALVIIIATKFFRGAWITIIAIPAVIILLKSIRGYYARLERNVRDPVPLDLQDMRPPIVRGPEFSENDRQLREQWRHDVEEPARAAGLQLPRLVMLQAQCRAMHDPVLKMARELAAADPALVVIQVPWHLAAHG